MMNNGIFYDKCAHQMKDEKNLILQRKINEHEKILYIIMSLLLIILSLLYLPHYVYLDYKIETEVHVLHDGDVL